MQIVNKIFISGIPLSYCFTNKTRIPKILGIPEKQTIQRFSNKRKNEFLTGRWCVNKALDALGVNNFSPPCGDKGEPIWPGNVKGSISHSNNITGAVVSSDPGCRALGLDIESQVRKISPQAVLFFTNPDEIKLIETGEISANIIFSIKESVLKALSFYLDEKVFFDFFSVKLDDEKVKIGKYTLNLYSVKINNKQKKIPANITGGFFVVNYEIISFCLID